jgi:3-oxoacyl-[acyl-carrier-protein] synthase-1
VDICLVGGIDSHLSPEILSAVEASGRLHSLQNSWGITPGEGSGFCLLASGTWCHESGLTPLAELVTSAVTEEPVVLGSERVCTSEGLSNAFEVALAGTSLQIDDVICDMNGETYRAVEFGLALVRHANRFNNPGQFQTPATCWGDVGAASGPLFCSLAVAAWQRGYARGPTAMLWASGGAERSRAATIIRRADISFGDSYGYDQRKRP